MDIKEVVAKLKNVREIKRRIRIEKIDPDNPPTMDDLETVPMTVVGYHADCPAHKDNARSLTVNTIKGEVQYHCLRGCSYGNILKALGILDEEMVS